MLPANGPRRQVLRGAFRAYALPYTGEGAHSGQDE